MSEEITNQSAEDVVKIVREGRILFEDQQEKEINNSANNRCFVQLKLYEIYFKPDGISYEDSKLKRLVENYQFVDNWSLKDHNEAVKLIKLAKSVNEFKAYLPTMYLHQGFNYLTVRYYKYYSQIIDHYESTGFLRELETDI